MAPLHRQAIGAAVEGGEADALARLFPLAAEQSAAALQTATAGLYNPARWDVYDRAPRAWPVADAHLPRFSQRSGFW